MNKRKELYYLNDKKSDVKTTIRIRSRGKSHKVEKALAGFSQRVFSVRPVVNSAATSLGTLSSSI